MIFICF